MGLSTGRWSAAGALLIFAALAALLLRDGFQPGQALVSTESLQNSLPWSAVMQPAPPHNRFLGDQSRIAYPYLLEAARVYRGEAGMLWTSLGGGGLPFLGNMTSSLLHPLTLLAAVLPVTLVPLVAALAVLLLSAHFTYLFLRRLRLSFAAALFGGLAFGFGGHQVLWLQYALSHTLLALPICFWAVERLAEDRSRRRVAVLGMSFALLVFGGHPETAFVAAIVAALWALWRLWDAHGRFLVLGAVLLGALLSAVQWMPFLEYALQSHGMALRLREAEATVSGISWGAALVVGFFLVAAAALLRASTERGFIKRVAAITSGVLALVVARRMGMAVSASVMVLPELYGSPQGGGTFTGAQDFPGLNSGYVGVLAALLLVLGAACGLGGGFVRFFALGSLLLWGTAFHMPAVESVVRALPGMSQTEPTRLLGPVAFMTACGGAMVLNILCDRATRPGVLAAVARIGLTILCVLGGSWLVLSLQEGAAAGRHVLAGVTSPRPEEVHDGSRTVFIRLPVKQAQADLSVVVDGRTLRSGPAAALSGGKLLEVPFVAQRAEEGVHWLRVESVIGGHRSLVAEQPLLIRRQRGFTVRDQCALAAAVALLVVLCTRRRAWSMPAAALIVGADVLSFGRDYNAFSDVARLYPRTRTVEFLQQQPQPFRIFTEGNILPPDTQFADGLQHLLSYDNLGYHRSYQWLVSVPIDMDAFARFAFSRDDVDYASVGFDLLDVRYVVTGLDTNLFDIEGFRLVHESETRVWENTDNRGRVFIVGKALNLLTDSEEDLRRADPRQTALLEVPAAGPLGGNGTARITEWASGYVKVEADVDGDALLVFVENRGPGWLARVDGGEEQPTLACDVAWQAVPLSIGHHEIVLRVDSRAFRWGFVLSCAAGLLALAMLLLPRPSY